mgnify:CR=1 FL=1
MTGVQTCALPISALADGTIANNALFNVEELTIANQTVYDVEFKVNHKLRHPLMIGKLVMNKVGDFRLDEANKEIIFEPK